MKNKSNLITVLIAFIMVFHLSGCMTSSKVDRQIDDYFEQYEILDIEELERLNVELVMSIENSQAIISRIEQMEKEMQKTFETMQTEKEVAEAKISSLLDEMAEYADNFGKTVDQQKNVVLQQMSNYRKGIEAYFENEKRNISLLVSGSANQTEKSIEDALDEFNQKLSDSIKLIDDYIDEQKKIVSGFTKENEEKIDELWKKVVGDTNIAVKEIENRSRDTILIQRGSEAELTEKVENLQEEFRLVKMEVEDMLEKYEAIRNFLIRN